MKTLSIVWQRLVNDQGKTCPRCKGTGDAVRHAVERLDSVLKPLGVIMTMTRAMRVRFGMGVAHGWVAAVAGAAVAVFLQ